MLVGDGRAWRIGLYCSQVMEGLEDGNELQVSDRRAGRTGVCCI